MEFKIERATREWTEFKNGAGQRVVFTNGKKGNGLLASKSLMSNQIEAVVAAHAKGEKSVVVA